MKNRGFTLIELLVVVAIIGMLSSVVLASLNTARASARDARRAQDIKQIQTALELYQNDRGVYPVSGWAHSTGGTNWTNLEAALSPYIQSLPTDPINSGFGYSNDQYGYSYYSSGYGGSGRWYMLVWELEKSNPSIESSDGVATCDPNNPPQSNGIFHYGSGTDGRITSGGSCGGR